MFTSYHYYITRDGQMYQTRHENLPGALAKYYELLIIDKKIEQKILLHYLSSAFFHHPSALIPQTSDAFSVAKINMNKIARGL